jgi:hypothetical protein
MPNGYVFERLAGIQTILNGVRQASTPMSSNTKGTERQSFIEDFLSKVLPPIYRFGTGDATDLAGHRSGQLDVVIEYPFSPSLPNVSGGATTTTTRLYLAESVASVIEVKSDISRQWPEAVRTSELLASVKRAYGASIVMGMSPTPEIPLFVASYTGWKTMASLQANLAATPGIAGILVIDAGLFLSAPAFGSMQATGAWALWGLICTLHMITSSLQSASTNPVSYAQ